MTFDEAEQMINDISDDQVEDRLGTAEYALTQLRATYAKPVEFGHVDYRTFLLLKEKEFTFKQVLNFNTHWDMTEQDLMRAWLHPKLIKVVE